MGNVFAVTYFETLFYSAYKPHPDKSLRLQTYPKPRKKLYKLRAYKRQFMVLY